MGSFVESKEEFLEKGKKAQIGEIREWKGQKFQKQPNGGWIPVKQGTKDSKKEEGFDWKKVTVKDMAGVPVGTKISFEDDLSGIRVVAEKVKDNSWKNEEGNTFTDGEMVESVSHPDAHDHKIEKPAAKKEDHITISPNRPAGQPRRGETVELTGGTGRKVTGKLHEVRRTVNGEWEGSIHIRGNEYFAGKVTRNLTREEKERQVRRGVAQRGLATANAELQKLGRQEARVLLDQEQDPEVLANMTDGNHPAVVRYSKMLTEIDKKKRTLLERVRKYRKELENLEGKKEEGGPKTFVDEKYGRKDKFEVVDEWPSGGYKVWNIGRSNFPYEGYIPLAQSTPENKYVVKLDTLKALKVGDEDLCLKVLKAAGQKGVDEEKFNKLKEEHKGKSPEKKEEPGKEALSEISKK